MQELEEKLIADFNANQKEETKSFGGGSVSGGGAASQMMGQNELEVLDGDGESEVPVVVRSGAGGGQSQGVMKEDIKAMIKKVEEMKVAS